MARKDEEKRGFLRVDDVLKVDYSIQDELLHKPAHTIDISGGGIRIETDEDIPLGSRIKLNLDLPTKEEKIACTGYVIWKDIIKDKKKYLCGISFHEIDERDREKIIHYVFLKHYGLIKEEGIAIEINNLTKKYNNLVAINCINLKINKGEIFALLGPNGAGKTTLTKILSTLLNPTSGNVKILGFDLLKDKNKIRELIGYMPQSPVLYDDLTARENLLFFAKAYNIPKDEIKDRIDEALAFCELQKRANSLFRTYSGGMKQRLSLACALLHRPKILFLDEPTAGVDLRLRLTFWEHFHKLSKVGVTIFVTTHQMDEVEWCSRVAFMQSGKIIIDDTPQNVKKMGKTKIFVFFSNQKRDYEVANYEEELPKILRNDIPQYMEIEKIEVEKANLESILRDLIKDEEMRD